MKKLIEKGIGIVLWCLQMAMLGVAVVSVYYFIKEIAIGAVVDAKSVDWNVVMVLLLLLIYILGGGLAAFIGACFSAVSVCFNEDEIIFRYKGKRPLGDYFYHYPRVHGIDSVLIDLCDDVEKIIGVTTIRNLFQGGGYGLKMNTKSPCRFIPEFAAFLRWYNYSILFSRSSNSDVEENREQAGREVGSYVADKNTSECKYKETKKKIINEKVKSLGVSRMKAFFGAIITHMSIPVVRFGSVPRDVLRWMLWHWFLILCTGLTVITFLGCDFVFRFISELQGMVSSIIVMFFFAGYLAHTYYEWWKATKCAVYYSTIPEEYNDDSSYKRSAFDFVDFVDARKFGSSGDILLGDYHILDIFQAFLDLHKDGWRMKIFPFSRERIHEEKRLVQERGEEIVIFPDVDEIDARLAEEERREKIIASIGDV